MSLYIVSDFGKDRWVTYEDTELGRIYAWVPNLGRFVFHHALTQDYYWDREVVWTPTNATAARAIIDAGELGKLDARSHGDLLDMFTAEPDTRSVEDVLGAQPVAVSTPSPQRQAKAKVIAVKNAKPGEWITYKTYPHESRQAARVAANDLRKGKIAAVRDSGLAINSRVTETVGGQYAVQIARMPT